jgi:hypothetical protein
MESPFKTTREPATARKAEPLAEKPDEKKIEEKKRWKRKKRLFKTGKKLTTNNRKRTLPYSEYKAQAHQKDKTRQNM